MSPFFMITAAHRSTKISVRAAIIFVDIKIFIDILIKFRVIITSFRCRIERSIMTLYHPVIYLSTVCRVDILHTSSNYY